MPKKYDPNESARQKAAQARLDSIRRALSQNAANATRADGAPQDPIEARRLMILRELSANVGGRKRAATVDAAATTPKSGEDARQQMVRRDLAANVAKKGV